MHLSKCHRILREGAKLLQKRANRLTPLEKSDFEEKLRALEKAIHASDKEKASTLAAEVHRFIKSHLPKTAIDHTKEFIFALLFALCFAFLIRESWFELYQVPTGSMRPTIEELDRLVVSKTVFGLRLPFEKGFLIPEKGALQRNSVIVFTVADMDLPDPDTRYFYLFPGKKRFVKRCLGLPGDTLYFYGGRIYGIDKEGHPIVELADEMGLSELGIEKIDHVPFISFEGRTKVADPLGKNAFAVATFSQMNLSLGRLILKEEGTIDSLFFNGKLWLKEDVNGLKKPHPIPAAYADLWGMRNYAMARLLTYDQVDNFYPGKFEKASDAPLYLELRHTPNLTYPSPEMRFSDLGNIHPTITPMVTLLPLTKEHLEAIQKAMITARFYVENEHAFRYHEGSGRPQRAELDPLLPGVPDGTYEFYYGKAYQIHFGGIMKELPPDHPLYRNNTAYLQKLFNLGINFNLFFVPNAPNQPFYPERFAYFRDGDLYLLGVPIVKKEDPKLKAFVESELSRERQSSPLRPYIAFIDRGAPLKDGKIDVEFIKAFGLKIPDDSVLALGDNYAMSADSRDFGFVPLNNLRGSPSFTFWPPGPRVGPLPQKPTLWITLPNILVWGAAFLICVGWIIYSRERRKRSLFK